LFTRTTHGASESSIPCRKTPKGGQTPGKRSQNQRIRLQSRPGKPSKQPKRAQPSRVGCRAAPETTKSSQTECEPPYSVARPSRKPLKPAQTECRPTHTVAELGRLRDSGVRLVRRTPSQQVRMDPQGDRQGLTGRCEPGGFAFKISKPEPWRNSRVPEPGFGAPTLEPEFARAGSFAFRN